MNKKQQSRILPYTVQLSSHSHKHLLIFTEFDGCFLGRKQKFHYVPSISWNLHMLNQILKKLPNTNSICICLSKIKSWVGRISIWDVDSNDLLLNVCKLWRLMALNVCKKACEFCFWKFYTSRFSSKFCLEIKSWFFNWSEHLL